MSNENAPYQVNVKTPKGSLLNIRAWSPAELDEAIDVLSLRISAIVGLENVIDAYSTASAAGLTGQVVSSTPSAPTAPVYTPPATPAAPVPAAPAAGGAPTCDHGEPMRFVAAGISKAGKPYKAFYACPRPREQACDKKVTA